MDPQPPSVPEPSPQTPPPTPPPVMNPQQWVMALYLSPLLGLFVFVLGGFVGPLIVWLLKRAEIPEIEQPGRDVLNFQISFAIYNAVAGLMCSFGVPLILITYILWLVFTIIGAVKASKGEHYKFPLTIKML